MLPLLYYFPGIDDRSDIPADFAERFSAEPTPALWAGQSGRAGGDGGAFMADISGPLPGQGVGLLASPGDHGILDPASAFSYSDTYTWQRITDHCYIGVGPHFDPSDYLRSMPALPQDPATGEHRPTRYYCRSRFGAGQVYWFVPIATIDTPHCEIRTCDQYADGEFTTAAHPVHATLAQYALQAWDIEQGTQPDPGRIFWRDLAICALQTNYALTIPELSALGMLTDEVYTACAAIITDREARKKKAPPVSPATTSGSDIPPPPAATAPPSSTSPSS